MCEQYSKKINDIKQQSYNNRILKNNICLCPDIGEFKETQYYQQIFKFLHNMYLENQADPMCYKCSYRCSSCSVKTENCTACPLQSYRDLGTDNACSCQTNMYEQPNNPICIPCHYTCLTCNGPESNQCTSCYTQIMRQLDPLGSCLCMNSYYDPGQAGCLACNPRCLNCENFADNCISCKSDRFLQGNTCICPNKINGVLISKYEKPGKVDCLSCHYSCLECNGSEFNQCTKCLDSEGRILINSTCVCASPNVDMANLKISLTQFKYQKWFIDHVLYWITIMLMLMYTCKPKYQNATIDVKLVKIYLQIVQLVLQTLLELYPFHDVFVNKDILMMDLILYAKNATILVSIAPLFLQNVIHAHLHSIEYQIH